jgi:tRNA G37 N-methylase Trm5
LFLAAVKYQIEPLKDDCESSLSETLSVATAIRRLTMAHVNSAPKLLEAAIKLLVKHKEYVWNFPEWKEMATNHLDLFLLLTHCMVADQHCGDCKLKSTSE